MSRPLIGAARAAWRRDVYRGSGRRLWNAVRARALQRNLRETGGRCEQCRRPLGSGRMRAECHHEPPLGEPGSRPFSLDQIRVVCRECHSAIHKELRIPAARAPGSFAATAGWRNFMATKLVEQTNG